MRDELYTFLHRPMWTKAKIRTKEAQIRDLQLMMLPGAIRYDKDKVQSTPSDPMAEYVERLSELEADIRKLKRQYLREQKEVSKYIGLLPDPNEADVLTARYITGLRFEAIAEQCHVSEPTVYRWHRVGINHLGEIIPGPKK